MAPSKGHVLGVKGLPLEREERLKKLMTSKAYGGTPVDDSSLVSRSHGATGRPKPSRATSVTVPRATRATRSLLHTTEAYRQQQGTTAETLLEVGKKTMTPEKAQQVERARAKVRGNDTKTRAARCPSTQKRLFQGPGHAMNEAPKDAMASRSGLPPMKGVR
eukprot:symbB.v1.2.005892.t1/scaffold329.1/size228424/2